MKVVIDIDDNLYTRLFDCGTYDAVDMLNVCTAIRKGTPLPKGHARLIDANVLSFRLNEAQIEGTDTYKGLGEAKQIVDDAPTIIEADKEEVKPSMQEPWEEFQPPCFDNFDNRDCDNYEIGEGGTPICTYDCERILENEPCHKYKTRGRDKE